MGTTGCEVRANYQHGLRWGAGIEVQGGAGHVDRGERVPRRPVRDQVRRHRRRARRTQPLRDALVRHPPARRGETRRCIATRRGARCARSPSRAGRRQPDRASSSPSTATAASSIEGGARPATVIAESWFHDCRVGVFVWGAGTVELSRTPRSASPASTRSSRDARTRRESDGRASARRDRAVAGSRRTRTSSRCSTRGSRACCTIRRRVVHDQLRRRRPGAVPRGRSARCDVLIALGLGRAHDLDDVPDRARRSTRRAREVDVWRVDPCGDRLGSHLARRGRARGVKWCRSCGGPTRSRTNSSCGTGPRVHAPLAQRTTSACGRLHAERRAARATRPAAPASTASPSCSFRTRDDFEDRFYDSDDGRPRSWPT